jgi:hypothetical protein
LLLTLGGVARDGGVCAPFGRSGSVVAFSGGDEAIFVPPGGIAEARELTGITVLVRDLATARRVLYQNGVAFSQPAGCREKSAWVKTHALWLQFLQR